MFALCFTESHKDTQSAIHRLTDVLDTLTQFGGAVAKRHIVVCNVKDLLSIAKYKLGQGEKGKRVAADCWMGIVLQKKNAVPSDK